MEKLNLLKTYQIISLILLCYLIVDALNGAYVSLWYMHNLGFTPMYRTWIEGLLLDGFLFILILFKKVRPIGLALLVILSINNLNFISNFHSLNPFSWFKSGYIQWGISIAFSFIAITLCLINLIIFLKTRKLLIKL